MGNGIILSNLNKGNQVIRGSPLRGRLRGFAGQRRGGPRREPACSVPDQVRRGGTCSNLLDAPKPHDKRLAVSYLILSSLGLIFTLLPDPSCDLPQSLNREQGRFGGAQIGIRRTCVVGQAGCEGSVVAVGHADNQVGIWPASDSDELHALAMQRMVRVRYRHPFHRRFGKGGSVL